MTTKAPKPFVRGIEQKNILNKAADFFNCPMGRELIEARYKHLPVFDICVRENYFNVYWKGCSVLEFNPNARNTDRRFRIHYKYINGEKPEWEDQWVKPKDPYVGLTLNDAGALTFEPEKGWSFRTQIIENAKAGSIPYVKEYTRSKKQPGEKVLLNRYIQKNRPLLIDLEVAFSRRRTPKEIEQSKTKRPFVADRIDLAEIDFSNPAKPVLKMIEAKRARDSRLASRGEPEVIAQMVNYQNFIDTSYEDILKSYQRVARNMLELGIVENRSADGCDSVKVVEAFAERTLYEKPQLLILKPIKTEQMTSTCLMTYSIWRITTIL
jgi:hypothetical protein